MNSQGLSAKEQQRKLARLRNQMKKHGRIGVLTGALNSVGDAFHSAAASLRENNEQIANQKALTAAQQHKKLQKLRWQLAKKGR